MSGAIAQPAAGEQNPLRQNNPGQQLQPSVNGSHCSPLRMQHTPAGWQVHRSSGQVPQLPSQLSSPHASSPSTHCGVHGVQRPLVHFLPVPHPGQVAGLPQLSMTDPQTPGAHGCG